MAYCRQVVTIHTNVTDEEKMQELADDALNFATRHGAGFKLGFDAAGKVVAVYDCGGETPAYCKGVIAEIKQMLKNAFHCKIDVDFYAY